MANFLGSLVVRIGADTASFQSDLGKANAIADREAKNIRRSMRQIGDASEKAGRDARRSFNRASNSMRGFQVEVEQTRSALVGWGTAIAGLAIGTMFVRDIVNATNEMIGFRQAMHSVARTTRGTNEMLQFVRDTTTELGLSFQAGAKSYAKLAAAARTTALTNEQLRDIFVSVSEAARVLNLDAEDVAGTFRAFEQVLSKGKVQAEELRGQIGERLPGAFQIAATAMGLTTAELSKQMELGNIYATELLPRLSQRLHELYGAQAKLAAQTPAAQLERFKNAWFDLRVAIGEAGLLTGVANGAKAAAAAFRVLADHLTAVQVALAATLSVGLARLVQTIAGMVTASKAAAMALRAQTMAAYREAKATERAAAAHVAKLTALKAENKTIYGLVAAQNALTRAQSRTTVATEAAVAARVASRASTAGKIGSSALALVGGPWGLAAAAIGGVAYAIYQAKQAEEERIKTFQKGIVSYKAQIKLAEALAEQLESAAGGLVRLTDLEERLFQAGAGMSSKMHERAQLRRQLADTMEMWRIEAEAGGNSVQDLFEKAERLRGQISQLDEVIRAGTPSIAAMADAYANRLVPAFAAAAEEIQNINIASGLAGIIQAGKNAKAAFDDARKGIIEAEEKAGALYSTLTKQGAAAAKSISEFGKTAVEVAKQTRDAWIESAKAASLPDKIIQQHTADLNAAIARIAEYQRLQASVGGGGAGGAGGGTEASREAARAAEELAQAKAKLNETLAKQQVALGTLTPQQHAYNAALSTAGALVAQLVAQGVERGAAEVVMANAIQIATEKRAEANRVLREQANVIGHIRAWAADQSAWAGMTRSQRTVARAVQMATREWLALSEAQKKVAGSLEEVQAAARSAGKELAAAIIVSQIMQPDIFEGLSDSLETVTDQIDEVKKKLEDAGDAGREAFEAGNDEAVQKAKENIADLNETLDRLQATEKNLGFQRLNAIAGISQNALRGIQSMTDEGSKAYAKLQVAIDATAVAQAILAVLTQATTGPGVGFATMAAMAAAVAPLLAQLGESINAASSAGFTDTAAQRQEVQGTGTVLGDAQAKSESIANATEITANATEQLVSINTGMLRALQSLQAGIGEATVAIAQGAIDFDFSSFNLAEKSVNEMGKIGPIGEIFSGFGDFLNLFGGGSEITDQGIKIVGGTISEMIENIMIGAYQVVESDLGWLFGGTETNEGFKKFDGALAKQFQLILQSIVTTVTEAAKALGIPLEDIKARIEAFTIATQHISLKDLTAEEKKAELLAVFSKIFDNLAAAVVPFIDQFQKVGEGLAETLVRVATDVQVMREAIRRLGLTVGEMGVEAFAQMSVAMAEAAGGIDKFIQGMQGFVQAFAPDEFIQKMNKTSLEKALGAVELALPDTRDAMWELMRSLDATTEAGRAQIATLLRVAALADQYYSALEDGADKAASAIKKQIQAVNDYVLTVSQLKQELGANPLADDIVSIAQWSKKTIAQMNALAKAAGRAGAAEEDLALVHQVAAQRMQAAISALHQESLGLIEKLYGDGGATSAVRNFGSAIESTAQKAKKSIDLLLGDLSPYTDRKKLQMALEGQRKGIVTPEQVLRIGRRLFSSGADYRNLFEKVMGIGDRTSAGTLNDSVTSRGVVDIAEKTLSKAERYGLSDKLANNIADLAAAQGLSFDQVAKNLGLDLAKLGKDLGLDAKALQEYLTVLASDNFGLTDLEGILANQVDRIITALGGDPLTSDGVKSALSPERAPDPYGNPPEPIQGHRAPPRAPDPYGRQAGDDGTRAELASLRAQIAELLERIADNTEGTRDGVRDLGDGIVDLDLVHNTRPKRV